MSRLWIGICATLLITTPLMLVEATGPALALCKPGTKNCTKNVPTFGHFRNTVTNVGDCIGTANDTCGLKTHPTPARGAPTTPTIPRPTESAGRR